MNLHAFTLGDYVRHPEAEDWGIGQVQSIVKDRVTVNFEHAGKKLINAQEVALVLVDPDAPEA